MVAEHLAHGHLGLCLAKQYGGKNVQQKEEFTSDRKERGWGRKARRKQWSQASVPVTYIFPAPRDFETSKISFPAGNQTFKPRVWDGQDCYTDHNRYTDMVGLLIHFLSSNTGETLQVNLAWGTKWLNGLFVSLCPSCYSFDFQRPERGH